MPPTMRPWSSPRDATEASASGKLAPHRRVAGSTVHKVRARSIWKV
jgi:hypothetical protein